MNLIVVLAIRIQTANSCTRWRGIFKGLSQNGGQADFSKCLRASLFSICTGSYQMNLISAGSISLDSICVIIKVWTKNAGILGSSGIENPPVSVRKNPLSIYVLFGFKISSPSLNQIEIVWPKQKALAKWSYFGKRFTGYLWSTMKMYNYHVHCYFKGENLKDIFLRRTLYSIYTACDCPRLFLYPYLQLLCLSF